MQSYYAARNRYLILYVVTLFVLLATNWEAVTFLSGKWLEMEHGTYNHGFLLLAMCVYLFYKKVAQLKLPSQSALPLTALIATVLLVTGAFLLSLINISSGQVLLIYVASASLFAALFGWQALRLMLPPFVLLSFALPFWGSFSELLQTITAHVSFVLLYLSAIPVVKDGFMIQVPAGNFEVASSCSGISYFLAAAALAIFYAEINYQSVRSKAIVIVSMVFAAIVANWIRVYIVIMAGQMTNMQHPLVNDHFNLGWMIFGFFFIVLLLVFKKKLPIESGAGSTATADVSEPAAIGNKQPVVPVVLIGLVLLIFLGAKSYLQTGADNSVALPAFLAKQAWMNTPLIDVGSRYIGAQAGYYNVVSPAGFVQVYHGAYSQQTQGSELISELNQVVDPDLWSVQNRQVINFSGKDVVVLEIQSKQSSINYKIWYWYRVSGRYTVSDLAARLLQLPGILHQDRQAEVFILTSGPTNEQLLLDVFNSLNEQVNES